MRVASLAGLCWMMTWTCHSAPMKTLPTSGTSICPSGKKFLLSFVLLAIHLNLLRGAWKKLKASVDIVQAVKVFLTF